jgi:dTDP-4-dehydrorhamnose reductase
MDILNHALITGGHGMVGKNINFGFKPTSTEMDITDSNSIVNYISKLNNITCIIHLAACNLRDSEDSHIKSINLNINGTTNMLKLAMRLNIPFIQVSSGAVFSSLNQNMIFDENYKTCPNSMYGYTKEASEKISLLYDKTILIRTGWLFGGNQKTHYKFVEHVINNLTCNNTVKASNNFYGSPTFVIDLIEHMKFLI